MISTWVLSSIMTPRLSGGNLIELVDALGETKLVPLEFCSTYEARGQNSLVSCSTRLYEAKITTFRISICMSRTILREEQGISLSTWDTIR